MRGYRDLRVWQKGVVLVREIYAITDRLPPGERFGLAMQMRRAAVSIPSNIAEGSSRQATADYRRFLRIARGSSAELDTQLVLVETLGLLHPQECQMALNHCDQISRMLSAMIKRLSS